MSRVNLDAVEAGRVGAPCRCREELRHARDVIRAHGPGDGVAHLGAWARDGRGCQRLRARESLGCCRTCMRELHKDRSSLIVDGCRLALETLDVLVVRD